MSSGMASSGSACLVDAHVLVFEMSVANIHRPPILRHQTAYLATTSCAGWLFVFKVTVPIHPPRRSQAATIKRCQLGVLN